MGRRSRRVRELIERARAAARRRKERRALLSGLTTNFVGGEEATVQVKYEVPGEVEVCDEFHDVADLGNFEEDAFSGNTSDPDQFPGGDDGEDNHFQCILCNGDAVGKGIPLQIQDMFSPEVDNDDLIVMFVLKKMLNVPREKLVDFVQLFGQPKSWISTCTHCWKPIHRAFQVQKMIKKLEAELRNYQAMFQDKIKSSWNELMETWKQPVTSHARSFVATGQWTDISEMALEPDPASQQEGAFKVDAHTVPSPENLEATCSSLVLDASSATPADYVVKKEVTMESSELEDIPLDILIAKESHVDVKTEPVLLYNNRHLPDSPTQPRKLRFYNCQLCPKLEPMHLQSFVQHIIYHKKRPFRCKVCGNFLTGNPLEFDHCPQLVFSLTYIYGQDPSHVCSPSTLEPAEFQSDSIWECEHCPEQFQLESQRDTHVETVHSHDSPMAPSYKCSVCSKQFSLRENWRLHLAIEHSQVAEISCQYCNQQFGIETTCGRFYLDNLSLLDHLKTDHPEIPCPEPEAMTLAECDFCGENFDNFKMLVGHVQSGHTFAKQDVVSCPFCFLRSDRESLVKEHLTSTHKLNSESERHVIDESKAESTKQVV